VILLRISDDYYWLGENKGSANYIVGGEVKSNSCQPTLQKYTLTGETLNGIGDYNPDQWPEEVWKEDMCLMKQAGVNMVSFGMWAWTHIQPKEGVWDWMFMDKIMDMLSENNIYVYLATPTAAQPNWLSKNYPEVLPVMNDGVRMSYGSRQTFCPSAPKLLEFNAAVTRRLAERYKDHPTLAAWHVGNEYSHQVILCHCEYCEDNFRKWLKAKYKTLDTVNEAWGNVFWNNTYGEWDEIISPKVTAHQHNPSHLLDYKRFMSDIYLESFLVEAHICREITPDIPISTNYLYEINNLNYSKWSREIDFVTVSFFHNNEPGERIGKPPFSLAKMRGFKHGKPFVILEQAANNINWREANSSKKPGVMRLWSYQALAHGADGLCFFQWRASLKGAEKFHSAMVPHAGENTRVFREIEGLGKELPKIKEIIGSRIEAKVAILFDFESLWALEHKPGTTNYLIYNEQVQKFYLALHEQNIPCDFVFGTDPDLSFDGYDLIIAPAMYIIQPGVADKVKAFVNNGGTFLTNFSSCMVDENESVFEGGYPGPLRDVMGFWVEEFESILEGVDNSVKFTGEFDGIKGKYKASIWADILRLDTANSLGKWTEDFYKGETCITENKFGKGKAYYIGTELGVGFYKLFLAKLCQDQQIKPVLETPKDVEATIRKNGEREWLFVLNHNMTSVEISLPKAGLIDIITGNKLPKIITLQALDTVILTEDSKIK